METPPRIIRASALDPGFLESPPRIQRAVGRRLEFDNDDGVESIFPALSALTAAPAPRSLPNPLSVRDQARVFAPALFRALGGARSPSERQLREEAENMVAAELLRHTIPRGLSKDDLKTFLIELGSSDPHYRPLDNNDLEDVMEIVRDLERGRHRVLQVLPATLGGRARRRSASRRKRSKSRRRRYSRRRA